jgi:hypothetical protein
MGDVDTFGCRHKLVVPINWTIKTTREDVLCSSTVAPPERDTPRRRTAHSRSNRMAPWRTMALKRSRKAKRDAIDIVEASS